MALPAGTRLDPYEITAQIGMPRKKLLRFVELGRMGNVVDGRCCELGWFDEILGPDRLVTLEVGCGHGDHTLAQARSRPGSRFLGVDRNGGRLWKGATRALDEGLSNAFFLRSTVEALDEHVPPGRVAEIWALFPDPLRKTRQSKHRLVSPRFLECYRRLLCPGGEVHLKTDDADLADFAERSVHAAGGRVSVPADRFAVEDETMMAGQTTFERRYRAEGRTIYERTFWLA